MPIKQSFCYPIFLKSGSFSALCSGAKSIGYTAVEGWMRDSHFEEYVSIAKDHGLIWASMVGHGASRSGLNDANEHDRIEKELLESIEIAARHDIANLICFSGNRRHDQPREDAIKTAAEGVLRVAPAAQAAGITLNLELLNSKVDHAGYDADSTAWGVEFCRRVDHPSVRLLYDIYHMQIMEGDVIRTIRDNIEWIGHFHTGGNPGRNDLDEDQELNYAGICRAIAETGYDGFLGHEFRPKGDPVAALVAAKKICHVE